MARTAEVDLAALAFVGSRRDVFGRHPPDARSPTRPCGVRGQPHGARRGVCLPGANARPGPRRARLPSRRRGPGRGAGVGAGPEAPGGRPPGEPCGRTGGDQGLDLHGGCPHDLRFATVPPAHEAESVPSCRRRWTRRVGARNSQATLCLLRCRKTRANVAHHLRALEHPSRARVGTVNLTPGSGWTHKEP